MEQSSTAAGLRMHSVSHRHYFLQLAAAGAASIVAEAKVETSTRYAAASGQAEALLLNCIDYRLNADVTDYMTARGLKRAYDQVILAGASLGALTDAYPAWITTFWDHLGLAIQLHGITKVIVIDHRDCGAYKLVLGDDLAADPDHETAVHTEWLHALRGAIAQTYPDLEVELHLMALDGSVMDID